ncbi:hypothetical protein [Nocardiopsis nanhaiensis]
MTPPPDPSGAAPTADPPPDRSLALHRKWGTDRVRVSFGQEESDIIGVIEQPDPEIGLLPIQIAPGAQVSIDPRQVVAVSAAEEAHEGQGVSSWLKLRYQLDQSVLDQCQAYAAAARAVTLHQCGLAVEGIEFDPRAARESLGQVRLARETMDAQLTAVHQIAGLQAVLRLLAEVGVEERIRIAMELAYAYPVDQTVADLQRRGWLVLRSQAQRDALSLLEQPQVWEAVGRLAQRLISDRGAQSLDRDQISELLDQLRVDYQVWTPP